MFKMFYQIGPYSFFSYEKVRRPIQKIFDSLLKKIWVDYVFQCCFTIYNSAYNYKKLDSFIVVLWLYNIL